MGQDGSNPRRGRLVAALVAAAILAAVPAGVALADGSGNSGSSGTEVQSTAPDGQQPDRRDCPEDHQRGQPESEQL